MVVAGAAAGEESFSELNDIHCNLGFIGATESFLSCNYFGGHAAQVSVQTPTKTGKSGRWTHQAVARILDRTQLGREAASRL